MLFRRDSEPDPEQGIHASVDHLALMIVAIITLGWAKPSSLKKALTTIPY